MIKSFFLSLFLGTSLMAEPAVTLVYDMANEESLPPKFRKSDDRIFDKSINTTGLSTLHASGSSQFSALSLKAIRRALSNPTHFTIVDLRDESHGFINGAAVTWYAEKDWGNKELTDQEAATDEQKRLASVKIGENITIHTILEKSYEDKILRTAPNIVKVTSVMNEETLAKENNANYLRLRVVDHQAPEEAELTAFVNFVKTLPADSWIHIHCRGGAGRTTTFLCILDILKNGKTVPLKDIIQRQFVLGGSNLNLDPTKEWKAPLSAERLIMLENFYRSINAAP